MKLKYLVVSFFWCGLILPASGICSQLMDNMREVEEDFNASLKKAFYKFNETDYFASLYDSIIEKSNLPKKHFSELSQEEYEKFKDNINLFKGTNLKKQVFDLLLFAKLAGCPILALGEKKDFFFEALHIYDPSEKSISGNNPVTVRPHEGGLVTIQAANDSEKKTLRGREITADLKDNAIIYRYLNDDSQVFDREKFEKESKVHYSHNKIAKISYDFLEDYIISPYTIENIYMSRIILGFKKLPKAAVNLMRGKAIYISSQEGNSGCLYMTSHNIPIISYLGLIPGIFIENNNVTDKNVVLMTGALIERSAFKRSGAWQDLKSIEFPYYFSGLESIRKVFSEDGSFFPSFKKYIFQETLESGQKSAIEEFCKADVSRLSSEDSFPREVILQTS
jgi:hypothetical protein